MQRIRSRQQKYRDGDNMSEDSADSQAAGTTHSLQNVSVGSSGHCLYICTTQVMLTDISSCFAVITE